LDLYQDDPSVVGLCIYDKGNIVSVSLRVPTGIEGELIGIINKSLRGYKQLGVFSFIKNAQFFLEKGYTNLKIGSINNDFKKQFLEDAVLHDAYSYVIFNKISNLKSPDKHLQRVF